jgi:hypothetical protein
VRLGAIAVDAVAGVRSRGRETQTAKEGCFAVYFLASGAIGLENKGAQSFVQQVFYGAALIVAIIVPKLLGPGRGVSFKLLERKADMESEARSGAGPCHPAGGCAAGESRAARQH